MALGARMHLVFRGQHDRRALVFVEGPSRWNGCQSASESLMACTSSLWIHEIRAYVHVDMPACRRRARSSSRSPNSMRSMACVLLNYC